MTVGEFNLGWLPKFVYVYHAVRDSERDPEEGKSHGTNRWLRQNWSNSNRYTNYVHGVTRVQRLPASTF
jgi:hypothetical protein